MVPGEAVVDIKGSYSGTQADRVDACECMQAGGREFHFKGMSQQDAKGWSQALSTACVLQYAPPSLHAPQLHHSYAVTAS